MWLVFTVICTILSMLMTFLGSHLKIVIGYLICLLIYFILAYMSRCFELSLNSLIRWSIYTFQPCCLHENCVKFKKLGIIWFCNMLIFVKWFMLREVFVIKFFNVTFAFWGYVKPWIVWGVCGGDCWTYTWSSQGLIYSRIAPCSARVL